jgi:hypothetical protein
MPSVADDDIVREGEPTAGVVSPHEELGVQSTLVAFELAVIAKTPQRLEGPSPHHSGRVL